MDYPPPQRNTQIPLVLLMRIIEHLEYLDVSECDQHFQDNHHEIMEALIAKEKKLFLRNNYSKIIYAKTEDERHKARVNYLLDKSNLYGYPPSRK
jgi:hypothetical protein